MRNIVCFHVSRSCGRLINKLDPLHTYNLTWSCCLECDKFGLMILSLLLLATPPRPAPRPTPLVCVRGDAMPLAWRFHLIFIPIRRRTVSFSFSFSFPFCFWLLPARSSVKQCTHTLAHTHTRSHILTHEWGRSVSFSRRQKAFENK